MAKKGKYAFWNSDGYNTVAEIQQSCRQNYINKYYNIWMSKFKWTGLDEEMASQEENFIMRKFWSDGTVVAKPIKNTDLMVFAPWALQDLNYYDLPETVMMVNLHSVSSNIIPSTVQVVNKDVVILYCQPSHKPILSTVNYYVDRMVQVDMVINTNLQLQKMPWLVGVDEADKDKMEDIVDRILNNEVVVFADLQSLGKVQTLATNTPYIIDKLVEYKRGLEQELMTILGVDNNGSASLEQTHVSVDAVNANNDVINDYANAIESEINKGLRDIKRIFNRDIKIEAVSKPVNTVHEQPMQPMQGGQENDN